MDRLDRLFEQFLRERTYIHNVTPATREWYECAWKAYKGSRSSSPDRVASAGLIGKADLQHFVVHLRQRGVRPVTCNTWIRALNAFCRWLHEQGEVADSVKLAPQRLEKRIIRTHDQAAIRALLSSRPNTFPHWRIHALVASILDTGCRIDELLSAHVREFDFDNLLLTVFGKGRKERRVPMSIELRRVLFRFYQVKDRDDVRPELMFPVREGGRWEHRNALRGYYAASASTKWIPLASAHVRHSVPTQRRRRGAAVDHFGTHRGCDNDEVSALADGGFATTAPGAINLEPDAEFVGSSLSKIRQVHNRAVKLPQFAALLLTCVIAWAIGRWFLSSITDPVDLWDAQVKLVQAIAAFAVLVVAWKQSQAAIEQLRLNQTARDEQRAKDLREQVRVLKDDKPIVFTQKTDDGTYRMVNVGKALAVNVWLFEGDGNLRPLGALAAGEGRTLDHPSPRQLFIAEARPHTGRRFTPTMNVRTLNGDVCHGFLDPENPRSLEHDGNVREYVALEPNLLRRFNDWQP